MVIKDVLAPERYPVHVLEKSGSRHLVRHDVIAARMHRLGIISNWPAPCTRSPGNGASVDRTTPGRTGRFGSRFAGSQGSDRRDHP
ncbi:MAG: hypothetical protein MZV64_12450 [Ignavibacteriales bacterium]|nr:hypothetical protein [Ignavibacteriales bacterium]